MKQFLKKYKGTIIYIVCIIFLLLYFKPLQEKYYLDADIKQFKSQYLLPILIWVAGFFAVGLFIYWLKKKLSFLEAGLGFLCISAAFAFSIFIFQDVFLSGALFINRVYHKGSMTKSYQIHYMAGEESSKNGVIPFDISTQKSSFDRKLINELYKDNLKQNDTVSLTLHKGLLGIAFNKKKFDNRR